MKIKLFTLMFLLAGSSAASAQSIVFKSGRMYNAATGVSNDGLVVGYQSYAQPYKFWNPETGEETEIGGAGAGNNVGGQAHFSADGLFLSGTSLTAMPLSQSLTRNTLDIDFNMLKMAWCEGGTTMILGQSTRAGEMSAIILGKQLDRYWQKDRVIDADADTTLYTSLTYPAANAGFLVGGDKMAYTRSPGMNWSYLKPVCDSLVAYKIVDFASLRNGVVALQRIDGMTVYYTTNAAGKWTKATGIEGTPVAITHTSTTSWLLLTEDGKVEKSTDSGATWSVVGSVSANANTMKFASEQNGYILADGKVLQTTDGGSQWTEVNVAGSSTGSHNWKDVAWIDSADIVMVGSGDVIYESTDGGKTWSWINEAQSDGKTTLNSVCVTTTDLFACGDHSTIYRRSLTDHIDVYQCSRYDVANKQWTALGMLGGCSNISMSSGYNISADGKTIVGLSYVPNTEGKLYTSKDTLYSSADAIAWNESEGLMDLGTHFKSRSSRGNAISSDGSVIVGYQELSDGLWAGAVWHKNPAGGYYPSEYLYQDSTKSKTDESNLLSTCTAVSQNGEWIGGMSDFNQQYAWIWSKATGYIDMGKKGSVYYISNDGSLVLGSTFAWTPTKKLMELDDYFSNVAGVDLDSSTVTAIQSISPNGRYIVGYGRKDNAYATYRIDLGSAAAGIRQLNTSGTATISIEKNGTALAVKLPQGQGQLLCYDLMGKQVMNVALRSTTQNVTLPACPRALTS